VWVGGDEYDCIGDCGEFEEDWELCECIFLI
jgi:hypothetical protein